MNRVPRYDPNCDRGHRRYLAGDLIRHATGKALDPEDHLSILEQKVKDLAS